MYDIRRWRQLLVFPVVLLEGAMPSHKLKLIEAWVEIHKEELMADWDLAIKGEPVFKIEPLK